MTGDSHPKGPTFDVPRHYGATRALSAMTTVAAPLLAAGAIALIGVILQAPSSFGRADEAVVVLGLAVFFLVLSVQCGFMSHQHATTPREIDEYWVTMPPDLRWARIRREQWRAQTAARAWGNVARLVYAIGITALWIGLALALVPPGSMRCGRIVAIAGAGAAAVFEICWTWIVSRPTRPPGRLTRRLAALSGLGSVATPPPERWEKAPGADPFD